MKQAVVIRKDLEMSAGKTAAQACHASLGAYLKTNPALRRAWEKSGAKKIVLGVNSLSALKSLYQKAVKQKIPCALIADAGATELAPGTITALGIGPDKDEKIDKVTSELSLFK
ncbi:MAG: peptidyl-tRNA hydrolase Pth2 [Candidatus Aenigmatarchaeota archaeon]